MSKFWSPQGANGEEFPRLRLSAVIAYSAFGDFHWINIETLGRTFTYYYPSAEARDADLKRLIAALEAE